MPLHFGSKEKFLKWEAYKHIHHIPAGDQGPIFIRGHLHHVEHTRKRVGI